MDRAEQIRQRIMHTLETAEPYRPAYSELRGVLICLCLLVCVNTAVGLFELYMLFR